MLWNKEIELPNTNIYNMRKGLELSSASRGFVCKKLYKSLPIADFNGLIDFFSYSGIIMLANLIQYFIRFEAVLAGQIHLIDNL
jgi:hypothetical protein